MIVYRGREPTAAGPCEVVKVETESDTWEPLDPRLDLRQHSPDGFAWGYGGSGPSQLALALLADALGNDDAAQELYLEFKRRVIAKIDQRSGWAIPRRDILSWVEHPDTDFQFTKIEVEIRDILEIRLDPAGPEALRRSIERARAELKDAVRELVGRELDRAFHAVPDMGQVGGAPAMLSQHSGWPNQHRLPDSDLYRCPSCGAGQLSVYCLLPPAVGGLAICVCGCLVQFAGEAGIRPAPPGCIDGLPPAFRAFWERSSKASIHTVEGEP